MTTPPSPPTTTSARPGPSDPPPQAPGGPSRRRAIGIGLGALAGVGLATWGGVSLLGDDGDGSGSGTTPSPAPSTPFTRQDWMSGVSGEGVADGAVAAARGSDLDISATWFDNNEAQLELWTLQPGAEFESWTKPLDISLGAIEEGSGETWAQAAGGAYDDRWRQSLTNLRDIWADRNTAYIRFAHEMNGDWYDWEVRSDEVDDFKTAWERYRSLQQEVFPASKLVFCVNRESTELGRDWRELYPGDGQVDVMSVDYYNQFPGISTDEEWDASMSANDRFGAPKGLQGHLDFAKEVGLPLAVSEWSGNYDEGGDAPVFVNRMNDFFARNGGTGAGQVLYEVQFNVVMPDDERKFLLVSPLTEMPESAAAYSQLDW